MYTGQCTVLQPEPVTDGSDAIFFYARYISTVLMHLLYIRDRFGIYAFAKIQINFGTVCIQIHLINNMHMSCTVFK